MTFGEIHIRFVWRESNPPSDLTYNQNIGVFNYLYDALIKKEEYEIINLNETQTLKLIDQLVIHANKLIQLYTR